MKDRKIRKEFILRNLDFFKSTTFVNEMGWGDIDLSRNGTDFISGGGSSGRTPKPSSTRKYICPCCGNSCRATKNINIGCLDCSVVMVLAEE